MGTRKTKSAKRDCTRDHPHAYGDKAIGSKFNGFVQGSSPRVWGQARKVSYDVIIVRDHPHAYGDKI